MPRTTICLPPEQVKIGKELRARYGGMMSTRSVGKELGIKDTAAAKWLQDTEYVLVNNRRRYRVDTIAAKIYQNINF